MMEKIKGFLKKFVGIALPYWRTEASRYDWLRLAVIIILTVFNVYLNIQFNEWKNAFYTALQNYNYDQVIQEMIRFIKLAALAIIVAMYTFYLQQIIALRWRKWLSEVFIDDWLHDKKYYLSELKDEKTDNPDQRVSEDIKIFIEKALKFSIGILNAALTFGCFVAILWDLSGVITFTVAGREVRIYGYIVWIAFAYAIIGTYITHKVGNKLSIFHYNQQRYEADFRFSMMRLKENSESIALYKGEKAEENILLNRLRFLLENFKLIIKKERSLTAIKSGYYQMASIFPVLVGVPLYMKNSINLGGLMQSASAFGRVQGSLSYFIMLYTDFAEWRSVIDRLNDFQKQLYLVEKVNTEIENKYLISTKEHFQMESFGLLTPEGNVLLEKEDIEFSEGENIIIEGINGQGKSTLIRSLAGIWPFFRGNIKIPASKDMLFLSQKTYLPLGSLAEILMYPDVEVSCDEAELIGLLNQFQLSYLTDKLNVKADWGNILSTGEQQKISIIRACIRKPKWLFLDEATSGIDGTAEEKIYEYLTDFLCETTIISVAHRKSIEKFHKKKIEIKDKKLKYSSIFI